MSTRPTGASLPGPRITSAVIGDVAAMYGSTPDRVLSADRHREAVEARWLIAYVLHLRGWSTPRIGRRLGRDHTTIVHGIHRVRDDARLLRLAEPLVCRYVLGMAA